MNSHRVHVQQAIQRFVQAFGRDGRDFGTIALIDSEQPLPAELPITGQIRAFYECVQINDLQVDGELMIRLASADQLDDAQVGWRWRVEPSGKRTLNEPTWNQAWLVIGDFNDNALFVDTQDEHSPVFGLILGGGEPLPLSRTFASFLLIMADCLLMEELDFGFDTKTDDFATKPEFIDRVAQIVSRYESEEMAGTFVEFFFG